MGHADAVLLADRGVVRISGGDAESFLDNLVTQDVTGMTAGEARFAALLSPQGKILFDFFVVRTADAYFLDVTRNKAAELAKRLALYKLRAKVVVEDVSANCAVVAGGSGEAADGALASFHDPRAVGLGRRSIMPADIDAGQAAVEHDRQRVSLGVPESGKDFAWGDAFPHEVNMDRLGGVSFTKGCFVGQEVVARMQHKTVVRKRIVQVVGQDGAPLTQGAEVKAGDATIGHVGSVVGSEGLAMIRLDRALEAVEQSIALTSEGRPIRIVGDALERYRTDVTQKEQQKAARI